MGLFDALMGRKPTAPAPSALTFTLADAGYTYDDGNVGLEPTSLTISERRVALIGLNGSGKTTLLKLLDGALTATSGTVSIAGGEESLDPAVKRDLKRIEDIIGRVRREEIPNSYYKAATIAEAIDEPLKKHKVPESERQAIIGNLFAHFGLAEVSRQPASALGFRETASAGHRLRAELLPRGYCGRRADQGFGRDRHRACGQGPVRIQQAGRVRHA